MGFSWGDEIGHRPDPPSWITHLAAATPDTTNHITGTDDRPCSYCRRPTPWLELSFGAPLCPGDCTDQMWEEFYDHAYGTPAPPPFFRSCFECEHVWATSIEYAEDVANEFGAECDPESLTFCPRCMHDW